MNNHYCIMIIFWVAVFSVIILLGLLGVFPSCIRGGHQPICVQPNSWIERHGL